MISHEELTYRRTNSLVSQAVRHFDPEIYYRQGVVDGSPPPPPQVDFQRKATARVTWDSALQLDPTIIDDATWDVQRFSHMCRYHIARELFRGKRVLDVGCGTGYGAGIMNCAGDTNVTGLDISPEAIKYAEANWGDRSTFLEASSLEIPFGDEYFDAVTCFELYEHVLEQSKLLREIYRVLRHEARLIISTVNQHHLERRLKAFCLRQPLPEPGRSATNLYHEREVATRVFVSEIGSIFHIEAIFGQYIPAVRGFFAMIDFRPRKGMRRGTRLSVLAGHRLPSIAGTVVVIARKG